MVVSRTYSPLVKVNSILTQSQGDTVQTGTEMVDPARKFKCTTAARGVHSKPLKLKKVQ